MIEENGSMMARMKEKKSETRKKDIDERGWNNEEDAEN